MKNECKVTARIDAILYQTIKGAFYHGQQTLFLRCVFSSIRKIIQENRFHEITDYLYKNKPLQLPAIEED